MCLINRSFSLEVVIKAVEINGSLVFANGNFHFKELKNISITINSVGSRLAAADHVGNNSSAHVAGSGRSRTNAVLYN